LSVSLFTLSNGVRICIEELPALGSAALGFMYSAGSVNESKAQGGLSHFLEHMAFKGTAKYSAKQIAEEFDLMGGHINAHTAKEYTKYHAVVLSAHLPKAIGLMAEMLKKSHFLESDIETERKVILEEIAMYEDTPDEHIHDLSVQNIWPGHVLGLPIIGSPKTVKSFKRKHFLEYIGSQYQPDRLIITIAGKVNTKEVLAQLEKEFAGQKGKSDKQNISVPKIKAGTSLTNKKTEQLHYCVTTPGISYGDDRRYTMSILNNILGGSMSSRLFQNIREKRGMAYSVYSYQNHYRQAGLFTIYVGTNYSQAGETLKLALEELELMKSELVTEKELNRAKEQMKGSMILGLESSSSRMSYNARSLYYYDRIMTLEEISKAIDKVSANEIKKLANELFDKKKFHLSGIGPFKGKNPFKKVL